MKLGYHFVYIQVHKLSKEIMKCGNGIINKITVGIKTFSTYSGYKFECLYEDVFFKIKLQSITFIVIIMV